MPSLLTIAIMATLGVLGCAREAAPVAPTVVERPVYIYVPEKNGPPVPPGPGIGESPLVAIAREERVALEAKRDAAEAEAAAREPEVVYVPEPYYDRRPYLAAHVYVPTPSSVVIVRDLPASQRKHTRWHYDRAAERCERRPTKWSRDRCLRGVAR